MKNIGIFGGGQLAKMIALEGYQMGLNFNIYDKNEDACSKSLASKFYNYDFLDKDKIADFFNDNDVCTYEFENISPNFLKEYEYKIPQGVKALELLQDRYTEKNFINSLDDIKSVNFSLADDINFNTPYIIKSRRNGYDGKGQIFVEDNTEIDNKFLTKDYIAEQFLPGIQEYSVVIGRSINGEIAFYEPIHNVHKKGILYTSNFADNIGTNIKDKMISNAKKIITALEYNGVLCVEYFVKDGQIYVNEIAPRVHNSGHLTIEGANISQFKLHLLCILGMPLPVINCYHEYYMINVLGQDLKYMESMQNDKFFSKCYFHIYGKDSNETNRKVGHITFKNSDNLLERVKLNINGTV